MIDDIDDNEWSRILDEWNGELSAHESSGRLVVVPRTARALAFVREFCAENVPCPLADEYDIARQFYSGVDDFGGPYTNDDYVAKLMKSAHANGIKIDAGWREEVAA